MPRMSGIKENERYPRPGESWPETRPPYFVPMTMQPSVEGDVDKCQSTVAAGCRPQFQDRCDKRHAHRGV